MFLNILLLGVGLLACVQARDPQPAPDMRAWPCPEADDIAPCVCSVEGQHLSMDCSDIQDDAELSAVFQANFPFKNFRLLTIIKKTSEPRVPITKITADTFNNTYYSEIRISHTNLQEISADAFQKSYPYIETLIVTDSMLETFPFDMFVECPLLTDVRVFRNEIKFMPDLSTDALTYLQISYNPLQVLDDAFTNAPNLEYIIMNDINLQRIPVNMFINQANLKYLDLSYNPLEHNTLHTDSLKFTSTQLLDVKLDANDIQTVEVGAISGS